MKPFEVLAPAGDWERLEAAVQYGADAVYLADQQFGMRAMVANFSDEDLKKAVEYCHARDVKVHLTCNVLPRNEEVAALEEAMKKWQEIGIDALIIADMGVFQLARRVIPEMELHVSTQAGVTNFLAATELYHLGAKRVVLARELSLEEIRTIRENTPPELDIEVFVHGAMCMSYSGRCLISQYLTGRDANHGECAQSCRWRYHLVEEKRPGEYYPVVETQDGTHFFNAQDLCMLPYLDKLAQAGVTSFKIEGRAKAAYYTAAATNMYRQAVDILMADPDNYKLPQWLQDEPYKVSHREYSTGFFFPDAPPEQVYGSGGYVRGWQVTAIAESWADGVLTMTQRNRFFVGDTLELLEPGKPPVSFTADEIINSEGQSVEVAPHPMEELKVRFPHAVPAGAIVRRQLKD